jgi:glycosyltransferase involved in cell wall biosynthesis
VRDLRLLVFSPYFPPHVGGLEGYASDLDEVLLLSGGVEAITVFTPRLPEEAPAAEALGEGHKVVRYPAFEPIPNFPVPKLWTREFWRALRSTDPASHDVFMSHTRFFLTSAFALGCARSASRPLLHVEHGSDYVQLSGRSARAAARAYDLLLGRFLLRHADGVVAISHAVAAFVRRLAGREVPVVHRGIWVERLDSASADERVLEWAAGRRVVTFAGRLIDGKGVPDLVRAFAAMQDPQAVLCIVGDGPRRAELEQLVERLGISPQTMFLGYVPEQHAWAVVRASDIVVNPSYTEGLPTSVLEAALMGKAVIATDVGGTPEIVTDGRGAILIKAHDIGALRLSLEELLADPSLRERLGDAARAEAAGRFDWNLSAQRFMEVVASLSAPAEAEHAQAVAAEDASSTSLNTDS